MSNKDNFYSLKMSRQHLDEAIGWMTILVESLDEMEDVTVVDNLGDSKAYFRTIYPHSNAPNNRSISNSTAFSTAEAPYDRV
jgi:hypothetical protein